jgi:undecaprenyl-diphosphatase
MAASVISTLSDHGIVIVLAVGFEVLAGRRSIRSAIIRLCVVGFPVLGANALIKRRIKRPRPEGFAEGSTLVRVPTSSSFPSGHTFAATAAAVALPSQPIGIAAGLGGAGLVGWSRIKLRAHHPSDVLGGMGFGILAGLLMRSAISWLDRE